MKIEKLIGISGGRIYYVRRVHKTGRILLRDGLWSNGGGGDRERVRKILRGDGRQERGYKRPIP